MWNLNFVPSIIVQGKMIDNIENNITKTQDYVEEAKKETASAVVYQSKARRVSTSLTNYNFFCLLTESFYT